MKKTLPVYYLLLLLLCIASDRLHASAILTGRMITVNPYGAQDTARNPALLSYQEQNNDIGVTGGYTHPAFSEIDVKEPSPTLTKVILDEFNGGFARLSYARTINVLTLGFDYYTYFESGSTRQNTTTIDTNLIVGRGTSRNVNMANLFTTSLSASLAPSQSIGIRLNCSYINNTNTDITQFVQASSPDVYVHAYEKSDFKQVSMLPAVGYWGKFGTSEIGIMMTTGRFSWRRSDKTGMKYDLSSILAQPLFKAKGNIPLRYAYTTGPSLLAGFHVRPSYDIGAGFEVETTLPATYRESFLISGDSIAVTPVFRLNYISSGTLGLKNRVALKPSVSLRGGFEFAVSRMTTFNIGIGFGYNTSLASTSGMYPAPIEMSFSEYRIISVQGTAGFDFLIGKNSTLTIGATTLYQSTSQTQSVRHSLNILATEVTSKIVSMELVALTSFGF